MPAESKIIELNRIQKGFLYAFIMLLPFIVFHWQIPFKGKLTLGNDYLECAINDQMELQYALKHGCFPLFIPGFAGGQTSAALTLGQIYHPISHLSASIPGYWKGKALNWNTLCRLFFLGLAHLGLFLLLLRLRLNPAFSMIISFITVYNLRMLDLFRYGAALENYTAYLFLCTAIAFYFIKPTRIIGPISIIGSTYLLIVGGHPQMMYLGLIGAGITTLFMPFIINKIDSEIIVNKSRLIKFFIGTGIYTLLGLLLSAVYIIPFYFDFLSSNSLRVGNNYQWSLIFSDTFSGMLNSFFTPMESDIHGTFGSSPIIILTILVPLLYFLRTKIPLILTAIWASLVIISLSSIGEATPIHYLFWKYFPLASNFRVPGRINMILPFLFLLMMAWLFHQSKENQKTLYRWLTIITIPIYLIYNLILVKLFPGPGNFIPRRINPRPPWVDTIILISGLISLILLVLYSYRSNRFCKPWRLSSLLGILLTILVIFQVTVELRYGTFVIKNPWKRTLAEMDKRKKRVLTSHSNACYGLESQLVAKQMNQSILEPMLAKFYRKYKDVSTQDHVYRILRKKNVTNTVVVEGATHLLEKHKNSPYCLQNDEEDWVLLEESSYNRVLFSVEAKTPGFFTLSFPYSNKWKVKINGNPGEVFRANGHMHAVYLEAGIHKLEFRYWSQAAFIGILTSCLTFLLIGIYFAFFPLRNKPRHKIIVLIVSLLIPIGILVSWFNSLYSCDNLNTQYSWSSKDFPPANNLAYAKKTKMGPGGPSFHASRGVDGNRRRPPFSTQPASRGWWQVDLGSIKQIGKIVIYDANFWGRNNLPLQILGSIDGKEFKLLKKITRRGKDYPWCISLEATTRFIYLKSSTKATLAFNEVEIYPPIDRH